MDLVLFILLLGCYGVTYAAVVIPAYCLALVVTRGGPHRSDIWLVAGPIAVYLLLTHVIEDMQCFNWYIANLVVAAPVVAGLFVAMYQPAERRSRVATIATGLASIVAVIAWQVVPSQGLTRLF